MSPLYVRNYGRIVACMDNTSPDHWGTMDEAANMIGVDKATIRRMITRGEVEAKRFGPRLIRVNLGSIIRAGRDLPYRGDLDD